MRIGILLVTILILASCGGARRAADYPDYPSAKNITAEPPIFSEFLYDLDYLLAAMEATNPHLDWVYRRHGIDIRAQISHVVDIVSNNGELDAHGLFALLYEYIFPLDLQGLIVGYELLDSVRFTGLVRPDPRPFMTYRFNTLNNPSAIEFYMGELVDINALQAYNRAALDNFHANYAHLYHIPNPIFPPSAPPRFPLAQNLGMNHIEPGRVAHLSIRRLHPAGDDSENLANFFAAIADYEHLIIDLRDNVGGNLPMIQDLVGPHIDEIIDIRKYIFFNSENPDYLAPGLRLRDVLYPRFSIDNVYTVAELLAAGRVPYLHPTDAARLSHGFETGAFRFVPTDANPFAGRKWILIDGDTRSAAEIYAMAAQIAGFATIVGEQTRGDFGKAQSPLYFILPNSGITVSWESIYVTDSAGRKLHEHHVIPDYPNREGMDALDTVLAMINEIR